MGLLQYLCSSLSRLADLLSCRAARMSELGGIYARYGSLLLLGGQLSVGADASSAAYKEAGVSSSIQLSSMMS